MVERKYQLLRSGPLAFLRGTAPLFYRDWAASPMVDNAPATWVSGDLHVENFGSYKGDNGLTYFDLNDFDETALAPATWDMVRLLASIIVGAGELGLSVPDARALAQVALDAYAAEVAVSKPRWIERKTARGVVRDLLDQSGRRTRRQLLDRYSKLKGKHRHLIEDDRRIWPISSGERKNVERMLRSIAARAEQPAFFEVLDVGRRITGNGALGVRRYIALVVGEGSPNRNALIDIKAAQPSAMAQYSPIAQPSWPTDAMRVAAVQHRAQAVAPALLHAASDGDDSFVIRELQPSADRMELKACARKPRKLRAAVDMFGRLAAWAHLRGSGWRGAAPLDAWVEFGARTDWQRPLLQRARAAVAQNASDFAEFVATIEGGAT